ncbi:MAG: type II toxin-antitoxin system RelE/ParE family toxin [Prolixibacteraceae bacterium]
MGTTTKEASEKYSLRITEPALKNIDSIVGYIAYIKHEPLSAIRIGDAIHMTIDRIEKNPTAFPECHEIPTKNKVYRKAICHSWYIIFKIKPFEILILGIINQLRRASRIRTIGRIK